MNTDSQSRKFTAAEKTLVDRAIAVLSASPADSNVRFDHFVESLPEQDQTFLCAAMYCGRDHCVYSEESMTLDEMIKHVRTSVNPTMSMDKSVDSLTRYFVKASEVYS